MSKLSKAQVAGLARGYLFHLKNERWLAMASYSLVSRSTVTNLVSRGLIVRNHGGFDLTPEGLAFAEKEFPHIKEAFVNANSDHEAMAPWRNLFGDIAQAYAIQLFAHDLMENDVESVSLISGADGRIRYTFRMRFGVMVMHSPSAEKYTISGGRLLHQVYNTAYGVDTEDALDYIDILQKAVKIATRLNDALELATLLKEA